MIVSTCCPIGDHTEVEVDVHVFVANDPLSLVGSGGGFI